MKIGKWKLPRVPQPLNSALRLVHNNNQVTHTEKLQSISLP